MTIDPRLRHVSTDPSSDQRRCSGGGNVQKNGGASQFGINFESRGKYSPPFAIFYPATLQRTAPEEGKKR